jgi:hypothetical protein
VFSDAVTERCADPDGADRAAGRAGGVMMLFAKRRYGSSASWLIRVGDYAGGR